MMGEPKNIPDWAQKERTGDLAWIRENMVYFWPAAKEAFQKQGRGVIVVDTTSQPTGAGHPFGYIPQEIIEKGDDEDVKRIVKDYDPEKDLVLVLLKAKDRTSTYRVHLLLATE